MNDSRHNKAVLKYLRQAVINTACRASHAITGGQPNAVRQGRHRCMMAAVEALTAFEEKYPDLVCP